MPRLVRLVFGALLATPLTCAPGAKANDLRRQLDGWRSYPLIEVIATAQIRLKYSKTADEPYISPHGATDAEETTLKNRDTRKLAEIDPSVRSIYLLAYLYNGFGRDHLHTFMIMDDARLAPEIADALRETNQPRHEAILRKAISLFGSPFPLRSQLRYNRSSFEPTRNPFDAALTKLASDFGTKEELGKLIEAIVRANPEAMRHFEEKASLIDDDTRASWLAYKVVGLINTWGQRQKVLSQLSGLPRPYQIIFLLQTFQMEMLNGSVHQFFNNSSGAVAPEVVEALRHIDLPKHANTVQRGIDAFPRPYPFATQARRKLLFVNKREQPLDKLLGDLTGSVDDGAIQEALVDLMKRENILPR